MTATSPTLHASAVLLGARAVLIRGPSGSGKSKLALALIEASGADGRLPFARLVADDRTHVEAVHGRVVARAPDELAGLIEVRGLGVRRLPYEPAGVVDLVVDLAANDADRMPGLEQCEAEIAGIRLPRLPVAPMADALALVLAARRTVAVPNQ
jgi:serine kinase of HPr protein (carbohydrate metabolism regulator)